MSYRHNFLVLINLKWNSVNSLYSVHLTLKAPKVQGPVAKKNDVVSKHFDKISNVDI